MLSFCKNFKHYKLDYDYFMQSLKVLTVIKFNGFPFPGKLVPFSLHGSLKLIHDGN